MIAYMMKSNLRFFQVLFFNQVFFVSRKERKGYKGHKAER